MHLSAVDPDSDFGRLGRVEAGSPTLNIDEFLQPVRSKSLRRLPRLTWAALSLTRAAAPRELWISSLLQVVAALGLGAQLLLARHLLGALSGPPVTMVHLLPTLIGLAGSTTLVNASNASRVEQQRLLGELVSRHASQQVIDVAGAVELLEYDDPGFHDRLQRARLNAAIRPAQMVNGVVGLISAVLGIVVIAGTLFVLSPSLLLVVLVAYVPLLIAASRASRLNYALSVSQTARERSRNYLFTVVTEKSAAAEIRAFGLVDVLKAQYAQLYAELVDDLRAVARQRLRLALFGGVLTAVLSVGVLGLLAQFVIAGKTTVAAATASAAAIVLLGGRLQALSASASGVYENALFLEDFTDFVATAKQPQTSAQTRRAGSDWAALSASDVTFTYPSRSEPALKGVSATIRRGEVVALVGENGSGKTTLAKVLAGLYVPQQGHVALDGLDLALLDPDSWREQTTLLLQDFVHYMLPVQHNIGFGRVSRLADSDGIKAASQSASADHFLRELPLGYSTILGAEFAGGSELSGGQWQRVALARAFFRDAPLIILDEPTSALDARGEAALFAKVRELYVGRTVILISHRLWSVRHADRIYVLSQGEVRESGTHDELMAAQGDYSQMYKIQAAAYQNERPPVAAFDGQSDVHS